MSVTITLDLGQLILSVGGGVLALLGLLLPAIYWAVKQAIRGEVKDLELRVAERYMLKESCRQVRDECDRHRHESAQLLGLPGLKGHKS